jgi:AraC family transcriptional regulator of adaptative response / DNA-3-methyladenine glycosylase II
VPQLLPAHQPYDARRMLWFLGRHSTPGLEAYDESAGSPTYARVLRLPGGPGVVQLTPTAAGFDAQLQLSSASDEPEALGRLARLLALDADPRPALAHLAGDPLLDVTARPGIRVPGTVDPVETLVETVIGQQISLAGARTLSGRLVHTYGKPLPRKLVRDGLTHSFPTAEILAAIDPADLPMPLARGRSIVGIGRAVTEQGEWLAAGTADATPHLLALPGVGPWTAAYQALRAGRDPDAFMPTDLAVRRALEAHGLAGDPGSAAARAARWSPYRSLALLHLWFAYLERRPGAAPLSVAEGTLES